MIKEGKEESCCITKSVIENHKLKSEWHIVRPSDGPDSTLLAHCKLVHFA